MKRPIRQMIREFQAHWKNYVFQSLFATVVMVGVFVVLTLQNVVVVASLGSTAFVIFALPKSITAQPRNVIGGNMVGLLAGSLCALIPQPHYIVSLLVYALAVGSSIFIMVVTDTEHPPASGLALGVAVSGFSWSVGIAVVTAVVVLSLVHHFFKSMIRDLV
jgi:CBS-domain-containing membrane protein